ncbi:MAG: preprotein translocase subunit YajC [Magnetococcus sp. DMHC-6]
MFDLIGNAYAQAGDNGTVGAVGNIVFMVLLFGIFYFLLIRPQQKQAKAHAEMVKNLQRGDSVVMGGGILGRIHRLEEEDVVVEVGQVEIGNRQMRPVRMRVRRNTITAVTAKSGTPMAAKMDAMDMDNDDSK